VGGAIINEIRQAIAICLRINLHVTKQIKLFKSL